MKWLRSSTDVSVAVVVLVILYCSTPSKCACNTITEPKSEVVDGFTCTINVISHGVKKCAGDCTSKVEYRATAGSTPSSSCYGHRYCCMPVNTLSYTGSSLEMNCPTDTDGVVDDDRKAEYLDAYVVSTPTSCACSPCGSAYQSSAPSTPSAAQLGFC